MKGKRASHLPHPQSLTLWATVAALLALGLLTTLVDFSGLSQRETKRANEQRQRFLINPTTGDVSLMALTDDAGKPTEKFDVGSKAEEAAAEPETPAAAEAPTAEASVTPTAEIPAAANAEPSAAPAAAEPTPTATAEPAMPADMPTLRDAPLAASLTAPAPSNISLVAAPAPEITEMVDGMKLPKRGEKDAIASSLYAQPFKRKPEQILLSFVVMDAGIDPQSLGLLMGLPKEVTVAYSPYARDAATNSENLRVLGHEVWTMLPTMTSRYPSDDPGPMGLVARMPPEEVLRRVREVLATVPGSVGTILAPNESYAAQKNALAPVVGELHKRGLFLLSTNPGRTVEQLSSDATLAPSLHRADLVLDPEANASQIRSKLAGLVASATEKGEYLVVLSARPQSLQLLGEWLKETKLDAPITLAPLSAMYQPREVPQVAPAAEEGGGHGAAKKEKPKPKPPAKKPKVLPQDKYLKPAAPEGGGHGGGEKKEEGGHH